MLTRLLVRSTQLLGDIGLVLAEQFRVETDVSGSVDTVHIAAKPSASESVRATVVVLTRKRQQSRSTWRLGGRLARCHRVSTAL